MFANPSALPKRFSPHGLTQLLPCNSVINEVIGDVMESGPGCLGGFAVDLLVKLFFINSRQLGRLVEDHDVLRREDGVSCWWLASHLPESLFGCLVGLYVKSGPSIEFGGWENVILVALDVSARDCEGESFDKAPDGPE